MITVEFKNMKLRVTQQSNVFCDIVKNLRGHLHVNDKAGVASFVEEAKSPSSIKNPIVWNGHHLTLRIDKEGKLRGTFRIAIPEDFEDTKALTDELYYDFGSALYHIEELADARMPGKRHLMARSA